MVDKSLMNNYLNDAKHSLKEMSGIYNFLGEFVIVDACYLLHPHNERLLGV